MNIKNSAIGGDLRIEVAFKKSHTDCDFTCITKERHKTQRNLAHEKRVRIRQTFVYVFSME